MGYTAKIESKFTFFSLDISKMFALKHFYGSKNMIKITLKDYWYTKLVTFGMTLS